MTHPRTLLTQGLVVAAALLAGVATVRSAAVGWSSERNPGLAAALWPSHPLPTRALAMKAIGTAAARGEPPPIEAVQAIKALVRQDPLASEPFTVAGTEAVANGRVAAAERLLSEAIERDPRKPAPRYLFAELSVRSGNIERGLQQAMLLTRRFGQTAESIVPALAAYARQPGAVGELRRVFRRDLSLRNAVLNTLAADPSSVNIVLALAEPLPSRPDEATTAWQERLLTSLIERNDYTAAYSAWRRFARVNDETSGLFNANFGQSLAPPPFNWRLVTGSAGTAEPLPSGGLQLMFYGREEAVLASQTLLLSQDAYRLTWQTAGAASNLYVSISCLPRNQVLASAPLRTGGLRFAVPASCPAQRLEFRGSLADMPSTVQPRITGLRLEEVGAS